MGLGRPCEIDQSCLRDRCYYDAMGFVTIRYSVILLVREVQSNIRNIWSNLSSPWRNKYGVCLRKLDINTRCPFQASPRHSNLFRVNHQCNNRLEALSSNLKVNLHELEAISHTFCLFARQSSRVRSLKIGDVPSDEAHILDVRMHWEHIRPMRHRYLITVRCCSSAIALRAGSDLKAVDVHLFRRVGLAIGGVSSPSYPEPISFRVLNSDIKTLKFIGYACDGVRGKLYLANRGQNNLPCLNSLSLSSLFEHGKLPHGRRCCVQRF